MRVHCYGFDMHRIGVLGIDEVSVFRPTVNRRHDKHCAAVTLNPRRSQIRRRREVWDGVPIRWKFPCGEPSNQVLGYRNIERNQCDRLLPLAKVRKELDLGQRKRTCAVDDPHSLVVPPPAHKQAAVAAERAIGVSFLSDPVNDYQAK